MKSHQGPINVLLVQDDDSSPPPAKQPHLDTATQSRTTTTISSSSTEKQTESSGNTSSLQAVSEEPIPDKSGDEDKMETSELEIDTTEGNDTVLILRSHVLY